MKFEDLMKKSPEDLRRELDSINLDMLRLKSQVATGAAGKDSGKLRELRRTIARIKTLQTRIAKPAAVEKKTKEVKTSR